jgi:hypothetical protein
VKKWEINIGKVVRKENVIMQNGMKWLKQSPIIFLSLYSMRTTNICAAYSAWAISESLVSLLKADNFN